MYGELADALAQAEQDGAVRAVLIQGDATIFSAGNDIGDFLNQPPSTQESPVFRFLRGIATFPKPIVAAVCGPAVGIGTTMLFHCDLVYAGDNAAFSMPFVNLGLCPEAASSLLVPQMFGYHRAAEALLLGEPFMAEAALEVGLVNRVVPPTEANAIAQAQARKLAAKPLSALIETKRLMKKSQQPALLERMGEEGQSFGRMLREPAAREAFTAFMEKRRPDFSNL
jgi:enoyl-CoA hydratase/carnithine racemase